MFSPYTLNGKYFEETEKLPPAIKSNFMLRVVNEQSRDDIINRVFAKRYLKESKKTETEVSEKLAAEISEERRKRLIQDKKRQQLRESNQELKELEVKLRAAYVSKSLAAQIAEREALRAQEKDLQRKENEILEKARIENIERERIKMQKEHKKKMSIRQNLLEQISLMQHEKAKRYEDFLKEKAIIDEIVRKIYDEQLEEMREKLSRKIKFREEMDDFVRLQKDWKEKLRRETEEENKQILEFLKDRDSAAEDKSKLRQMEMKLRQDISEKIGNEILAIKEQKRKREELLQDLHVEERKALEEQKIRDQMEKTLRERILARLQMQEYKEEILRRRQQEQEEDKHYREEQMRVLAERDKLEQLSNIKRHQKVLEHRRAIQDCLEEKKLRRAEEFAILLKEREQDLQQEKTRQELIEEERIRMLKEHATVLLGYLPPGVLKESDREHLPLPQKK